MPKADQISQIINLIFNVRQLLHEKLASGKDGKVSFLQMITMLYIKKKKPLMKEVADYLAITPPSATSVVNSLIEEGNIMRVLDPEDRRIVRVAITKKGEKALRDNQEMIFSRMRKSLEYLSTKEQKDLARILNKVVEAYKK